LKNFISARKVIQFFYAAFAFSNYFESLVLKYLLKGFSSEFWRRNLLFSNDGFRFNRNSKEFSLKRADQWLKKINKISHFLLRYQISEPSFTKIKRAHILLFLKKPKWLINENYAQKKTVWKGLKRNQSVARGRGRCFERYRHKVIHYK